MHMRSAKTLIRLRGCAGGSASSLVAHVSKCRFCRALARIFYQLKECSSIEDANYMLAVKYHLMFHFTRYFTVGHCYEYIM